MSGPRQARTVDPRIKSPLLYRLSYRPHCVDCPQGAIVSEKTSVINVPLRLFQGDRGLQLLAHPLGVVQQRPLQGPSHQPF